MLATWTARVCMPPAAPQKRLGGMPEYAPSETAAPLAAEAQNREILHGAALAAPPVPGLIK